MDRRDFIKKGAMAIAGAMVGGTIISELFASQGCAPAKGKRIGLQLYSLREAMGTDPEATLRKVAAMGYIDLETASYDNGKVYGYSPKEFRALVEGMGMKVTSCHIGGNLEQLTGWWDKAMDDHKAMGCKYVVMPSTKFGTTPDELATLCSCFNTLGAMAREKELMFGYHNHADELTTIIDGRPAYDIMIEGTTPDVAFEMDVYWVQKAGADPVEYLGKYSGRFPLLHIKDEAIIGDSGKMAFDKIFEAAYRQGMKDFYVEVERYPLPPEICVEKSFDFLDGASYVN